MSDQVQIRPSVLKAQVEEGWKLKPLAEHYGLPVAQMSKALKALGLTIRKFHAPKFAFVEESVEEIVVNAEEVVEEFQTEAVQELPTSAPIQAESAQEVLGENQTEENRQSGDW
jgi:hypothetical protein